MAVNGLEKPFRKKSDSKNRKNSKNQSEIAACEQKTTGAKWKFNSNKKLGLEWAVNGLGKPFRK